MMKRFVGIVCALLCLPIVLLAQNNERGLITAASSDCSTSNSCVVLPLNPNTGSVAVQIIGTYTATLQFEAMANGATWTAITGSTVGSAASGTSTTTTGIFQFATGGLIGFRVRASAYTSGGANTLIQSSAAGSGGGAVSILNSELADILTAAESGADSLDDIETAVESDEAVVVLPSAVATGGVTACVLVSTGSTNANACGTAATGYYGVEAVNTTTTIYYLRLYNTVGAPTCSSATGFIRSIPVPPASAAGGAGGIISILAIPETASFTTGLGYCITAGSSSTDNTNAAIGIFGAIYKKQ